MRTVEHIVGEADVLKVFKLTGTRKSIAAGCRVKDGILDNSSPGFLWRVVRNHDVIYEGILTVKYSRRSIFFICKVLTQNYLFTGLILDYN